MNCCSHLSEINNNVTPKTPNGCEECLKMGDRWLHLRLCVTCGHVGCCEDSKNKHATKHFHSTNHPLIKSFEPGEDWGWCYVDDLFLESVPGSLTTEWCGALERRPENLECLRSERQTFSPLRLAQNRAGLRADQAGAAE